MSASGEQLQLMLIDGAIRFSHRALEGIAEKDIEKSHFALERAQRIVLQLAAGLQRDVNPELVDQMTALFEFIHSRLVEANITRQTAHIDDALKILNHQRETWALLIDKITKEIPRPGDSILCDPHSDDDPNRPVLSIEG
ncbi:MAG: flagellar export chaperone FliS [Planctomycetes bacterium]|nr:flagellar export chaperone FliS [Planctomycetota bacterium]